jgi:ATP-dependent Lon protease
MNRLRIIPLDDQVAFPGMPVTLPVDVGTDTQVLLVPRQDGTYAKAGVVADVSDRVRLAGRGIAVTLMPLHRAIPGAAAADADGVLRADVEARPDTVPAGMLTRELEREYRAVVDEMLELRGDDGRIRAFVRSITEPGALADTAGYSPDLNYAQKLQLLETFDVVERLKLALQFQRERLAELQVRKRIRDDVEDGAQKQQREYFLRRQMDAIRKELGETEGPVADEYRTKIGAAGMPESVRQHAERELARLAQMGEQNAEAATIRTYLDWLLAVPWAKRSDERLDPLHAREVLDADHEGLDDVKRRITEYLAVRKLRTERGMTDTRRSGVILTLIGPPGTGKTSIGESIARATGRQFVRMALGGVRDEAEIRGHRRTYIGAMPGRLVRALRDAGTMNPVIMLDEVDKIGADWRGDPSAALLEVLDPAQNHAFRDHYLDVELDLSQVLFIATANVADTIPRALFDRMEVIRFDGYTTEEKVAIARGHLWPRQLERNGLRADEVTIDEAVLRLIVTDYTREAGVRQLERELGTLLQEDRHPDCVGEPRSAGGDRHGCGARRARPHEVLPRGGGSHGGARRGYRSRSDGRGRRRAVRRGRLDGRPGRARADGPARRRDEGVGAHRAHLREEPRPGAGHRRAGPRWARAARARARRRDPEGWAERGRYDGHGHRVAADAPAGEGLHRHDRRGHAAGPGAADRRREAEGAGRTRGGPHRGDHPRAQRARPGRRAGRGARSHALPRRRLRRPGPGAGAGIRGTGKGCVASVIAPAAPRAR